MVLEILTFAVVEKHILFFRIDEDKLFKNIYLNPQTFFPALSFSEYYYRIKRNIIVRDIEDFSMFFTTLFIEIGQKIF